MPRPDYLYGSNRHYRKCKRTAKAINVPAWAGPVISSSYGWERDSHGWALCKALHFRKMGLPVPDAAFRIRTASAYAQNLDRDVIRSAAFPGQFDQLAARFFRAFVFHCAQNLRVAYQPPQSVATDQEHVLRAQWLRSSG